MKKSKLISGIREKRNQSGNVLEFFRCILYDRATKFMATEKDVKVDREYISLEN